MSQNASVQKKTKYLLVITRFWKILREEISAKNELKLPRRLTHPEQCIHYPKKKKKSLSKATIMGGCSGSGERIGS